MSARILGNTIGASVELAPDISTDGPVWEQICRAGAYKGHRLGEIEFTAETFAETVANFRTHPAFRLGPDGHGNAPVVQYDYEHASEMPPTSGTIPQGGAPAAGWVLDLEVRMGGDQVAELWALSTFLPATREQIRSGAYRWTSVAIDPKSLDPVTGEERFNVLTSVALTNHPFIQGMAPLVARAGEIGHPGDRSVSTGSMADSNPRNQFLRRLNARLVSLGLIKLADAPDEEVVEVAEKAADLLDQVMDMIGSPEMEDVKAKLAKTCSDADSAKDRLDQLEALRAALRATSEEKAEDDAAAVATLSEGEDADEKKLARVARYAKIALMSCINQDGAYDQAKRSAVLKDYDVSPEQIKAHKRSLLTTKLLATATGGQLGGPETGLASRSAVPAESTTAKTPDGKSVSELLAGVPGANDIAKARAYLLSAHPEFRGQREAAQYYHAAQFLNTGRLVLG